jgi:tetratricopeptide (TPR) repeat protein
MKKILWLGNLLFVLLFVLSQKAYAESLEQLYKKAYTLEGQGKPAEEEVVWQEIVRRVPNNASNYSNLGIALLGNGKPDKAVTLCRQALKIDSRYSLALVCLRTGLVQQKKYSEAEAFWRQMIQKNPKDVEAYADLGYILREQGKLSESVTICKETLKIVTKNDISLLCITDGLIRQNKISEAISVVDESIQAHPSTNRVFDTQLYVMLGNQLQNLDYLDEAISVYRKAIRFDPGNPQPQQELDALLRKKGG